MRHKFEMDTIGGEEVAVERYANDEWESAMIDVKGGGYEKF